MSEKIKYNGYKIKIVQDEYPLDPRAEFDNLGEMICFHRRWKLGDDHNYTVDEVIEMVESGDYISLPLYLYDHGGLTISPGAFSCPWDSGQLGYILISKAEVKAEWGWKKLTRKRQEKIEQLLRNEVEQYDQFLTGDVWGYEIKKDGEFVDSCWGFYGYDYCLQEAKRICGFMTDINEFVGDLVQK